MGFRGDDSISFSKAGTGTDPLWGLICPSGLGVEQQEKKQVEFMRLASAERALAGAGPKGRAGRGVSGCVQG